MSSKQQKRLSTVVVAVTLLASLPIPAQGESDSRSFTEEVRALREQQQEIASDAEQINDRIRENEELIRGIQGGQTEGFTEFKNTDCRNGCMSACPEPHRRQLGITAEQETNELPLPAESVCYLLYESRPEFEGLTGACRAAILRCGAVAREIRAARLRQEIETLRKQKQARDRERAEIGRDIARMQQDCPNCAMIEAMRPRDPGLGDYIVGGLQAITPMVLGGIGSYMHANSLEQYYRGYNGYLNQCIQVGVPCVPPMGGFGMGGLNVGMGGGMGMGGLGGMGMGIGLGGIGGGLMAGGMGMAMMPFPGGMGIGMGMGMGMGMAPMGMGMMPTAMGMGMGIGMGMGMAPMGMGMMPMMMPTAMGMGMGIGMGMGMAPMGMGMMPMMPAGLGMGFGMAPMGMGMGMFPSGNYFTQGYGVPVMPWGGPMGGGIGFGITGIGMGMPMPSMGMMPTAMGMGMGMGMMPTAMGMGMGMGPSFVNPYMFSGGGNMQMMMMQQQQMQSQMAMMQQAQMQQDLMMAQQQMMEAQMRYQQIQSGMMQMGGGRVF